MKRRVLYKTTVISKRRIRFQDIEWITRRVAIKLRQELETLVEP